MNKKTVIIILIVAAIGGALYFAFKQAKIDSLFGGTVVVPDASGNKIYTEADQQKLIDAKIQQIKYNDSYESWRVQMKKIFYGQIPDSAIRRKAIGELITQGYNITIT